ncbi:hypothetical protein ETD86_04935 [Nonomuraea turkmeniaca]|uniref:Uncharacterized protein n=1 Tax=Nonomuraea turkmeniaca TaxID=103838 RepID=A0A5S4FVX4_9ACTN|nr:hypothetical protein ETD86_04935 [Nonomuraea turkmeniaca]
MTPDNLLTTAAITLPILLTLRYVFLCYARPFREHRRCRGTGRIPYPFGLSGWRFCPRCNGTVLRLRLGREQ